MPQQQRSRYNALLQVHTSSLIGSQATPRSPSHESYVPYDSEGNLEDGEQNNETADNSEQGMNSHSYVISGRQEFEALDSAKQFLKNHSMERNKCLVIIRACKGGSSLAYGCKSAFEVINNKQVRKEGNMCPFLVRLKKITVHNGEPVTKWRVCNGGIYEHKNCSGLARPLTKELSGTSVMRGMVLENRTASASSLHHAVKSQLGVNVPLHTLYRAREVINQERDSTFLCSIQKVPNFLQEFVNRNPGSSATAILGDSNVLKNVFLGSSPMLYLLKTVLPCSSVDAAHFKNRLYRGQMFVRSVMDSNGNLFPAAIGMSMTESEESWTFFFNEENKASNMLCQSTTFSDRAKGLDPAFNNVYPDRDHVACAHHILKNAKAASGGSFGGSDCLFWGVQRAKTSLEYKENLEKLRHKNVNGGDYIDNIEHKVWASYAWFKEEIICCGRCTSQNVESENSRLLSSRQEDPLGALDKIIVMQAAIIEKGRKQAMQMKNDLSVYTPFATKLYNDDLNRADSYNVITQGESDVVFVKGTQSIQNIRRRVDFLGGKCSCHLWQQRGIPCVHAIAAARATGRLDNDIWYNSSFWNVYKATTFCQAYLDAPSFEFIDPLEVEAISDINAPPNPKRCGRPKKRRIPSRGENDNVKKYRCGRCLGHGHNRSTCLEYKGGL